MVQSPRLSFNGYSFKEALYRNKDNIKVIVAILAGVNTFTGFDWKNFSMSLGLAVIALGVKLLSDAVDFYFSTVEL